MKWSAYQRVQQIGAVLHDTATWLDGLARTQSRIVRRDALRQAATFASELQLELVVLDDEALRIKAECFDAACTVVDSVGNDSDHFAEIEALLGVARDRIRGLGERDAVSVGKRLPSDKPTCSGRVTWLKTHGCEALASMLNCTAAEVDAALTAIYFARALAAGVAGDGDEG